MAHHEHEPRTFGTDEPIDAAEQPAERVAGRAELLPEEERAGSDDPMGQAETILEESDQRQADREAAPDTVLEHRTSDDVTPPVGE